VSVIDGDLTIGESSPSSVGVTSVAALSCLTRVTGTVTFVNTALRDLRGMERLTEVDGWLSFDGNGALTSLSGLDGLTTVGGTLELGAVRFAGPSYWYSSPPVESLCPLRNLRSLGGLLAANLPLQNLSGLEHLTELGSLILFQTESLRSLRGLENLQRIYGEGSLRSERRRRDISCGARGSDASDGASRINAAPRAHRKTR
jgi:hypothetical protein